MYLACGAAIWLAPASFCHAQTAEKTAAAAPGKLQVATCQFPVCGDVRANADRIRRQMREARERGADLVHFPECALSGYAGEDVPSPADLDWGLLHKETDAILALAKELGVWVVLGSTHRLSGDHKPHDSLYPCEDHAADAPGPCGRELHVHFGEQFFRRAQLAEPVHHARRAGGRRIAVGSAGRHGQSDGRGTRKPSQNRARSFGFGDCHPFPPTFSHPVHPSTALAGGASGLVGLRVQ
jgi:hypothetical protein